MNTLAIIVGAFCGAYLAAVSVGPPRFIPGSSPPPRTLREKQETEVDDLVRMDLLDHLPLLQRVHRVEAEHHAYAELAG